MQITILVLFFAIFLLLGWKAFSIKSDLIYSSDSIEKIRELKELLKEKNIEAYREPHE